MPIWLDYVILDIDTKDYSYLVASSPATSGFGAWMYIMTRQVLLRSRAAFRISQLLS